MNNSSQRTNLLSVGDNSIFFKVAEGNFAARGKESSYENKENISIEKGKHRTWFQIMEGTHNQRGVLI